MTKRARKKVQDGSTRLELIRDRIGQEEFAQLARLTDEQMYMLDEIASGRAPRHARDILNAISLKCEYAYSKPKQKVEHSGAVISFEISGMQLQPVQAIDVTPAPALLESDLSTIDNVCARVAQTVPTAAKAPIIRKRKSP